MMSLSKPHPGDEVVVEDYLGHDVALRGEHGLAERPLSQAFHRKRLYSWDSWDAALSGLVAQVWDRGSCNTTPIGIFVPWLGFVPTVCGMCYNRCPLKISSWY